ncbi:hypothetical protein N9P17_02590 [Tateyamaria sp.]|nr:hypothetical protein [Tateyamaria sp.]
MTVAELVDFGLEPIIKDSRFKEAPQSAVDHVLTASREAKEKLDEYD